MKLWLAAFSFCCIWIALISFVGFNVGVTGLPVSSSGARPVLPSSQAPGLAAGVPWGRHHGGGGGVAGSQWKPARRKGLLVRLAAHGIYTAVPGPRRRTSCRLAWREGALRAGGSGCFQDWGRGWTRYRSLQ